MLPTTDVFRSHDTLAYCCDMWHFVCDRSSRIHWHMLIHDPNQSIDGNYSDMTGCVMIVLGGNAFVKTGEQLTMAGQFQFAQLVPARLEATVLSCLSWSDSVNVPVLFRRLVVYCSSSTVLLIPQIEGLVSATYVHRRKTRLIENPRCQITALADLAVHGNLSILGQLVDP